MKLLTPTADNRIGVSVTCKDNGVSTTSSIINAVEIASDSPFITFHFGKETPTDDRGMVVLEAGLVKELMSHLKIQEREGEEIWVEYR